MTHHELKIDKTTSSQVIICGAEYAREFGAEIKSSVRTGEDGVFDISAKRSPKARTYHVIGCATTDVAEIAVVDYSNDFYKFLCRQCEGRPFLFWCDTTIADWQRETAQVLHVSFSDL